MPQWLVRSLFTWLGKRVASPKVASPKLPSFRKIVARIKKELSFYRRVLAHPDTPWLSRILLGAAIAYFLTPTDLIPDFIPVLGHLDDLLIVPGLIWLSFRFIPPAVIQSCRLA